ncbi:nucleotide exchange factor GrpE [Cyanobium sp. ATX 6F1]|uniref:nucleotide exchange factor GrpE n=1 Tax=Cyanobium sp. ATX 6F1 TaxID=2823702 RepID=UPI0020CE1CF8|nr:nucleotide exchange factor GrpE [Cyanobium sp. ATX 6F1]MCP9917071.1 nucleotide exchange factor GrpE [Cyanobium sp. ATX 6F1]
MSGEATPSSSQGNHAAEGASDHPVDDLNGLGADAGQAAGEPVDASAQADAFRAPQAEGGDAERRPLLEAEIERLKADNESLRAQYMRIAADFDNFRKRQSRDQDDLKQQIICSTLSEVLPVVDNFDRARQQLNPEGEEALSLHRSYQGLYKQLVDVFKQLGVSPMRVEGEPFDPSLHEAVLREPSEEHPEDVVIAELQRGYHLDGRVLRHALVKVSMGPGPSSGDAPNPAAQDVQAG